MPILANPKHERFAQELAKNVMQQDAYVNAGYSPNKGAASRLAQSPKLIERVGEIKGEIASRMAMAVSRPEEPEHFESLAEMGIDMNWVAGAFKKIYTEALETKQLGAANTAVANIQKLLEMEKGRKSGDDEDDGEGRVKVSDAIEMLKEMRKVAELNSSSAPRDVTPRTDPTQPIEEAELVEENPMLLPDLGDYLEEE